MDLDSLAVRRRQLGDFRRRDFALHRQQARAAMMQRRARPQRVGKRRKRTGRKGIKFFTRTVAVGVGNGRKILHPRMHNTQIGKI